MNFPRYVFKRGTGQDTGGGRFVAESVLVDSPEALAALGSGWCSSPVEAAAVGAPKPEEKPAKKAK